MNKTIITVAGIDALAQEAALYIQKSAEYEIRKKGAFTLVLSGGRTPEILYRRLAGPEFAGKLPWAQIYIFWGDERFVPHDHPESNYRMALHFLIKNLPIPEKNIFPVQTDSGTAVQAAEMYEKTIRNFFSEEEYTSLNTNGLPSFDLMLLGMGADGHTASLYEEKQTHSDGRWVIAVDAPRRYSITKRVTFTLPVINNSKRVVFLVSGPEKKDMLEIVLGEKKSSHPLPAKMVRAVQDLIWLTDINAKTRQ